MRLKMRKTWNELLLALRDTKSKSKTYFVTRADYILLILLNHLEITQLSNVIFI